jgi:hypothetical protein
LQHDVGVPRGCEVQIEALFGARENQSHCNSRNAKKCLILLSLAWGFAASQVAGLSLGIVAVAPMALGL